MKMKRILFIAALFAITLSIGSCKKDISLNPSSGVVIDAYFKNQKDITASLAGIYSAFQEEMTGDGNGKDEGYGGRYHYWGEVRADNFAPSTFTNYSVIEASNNTMEFSNGYTDWAGLYKVISRTNLAIKYYPQVPAYDPNVTPTILNNSLAQAYAMRAEAYFYVVRVWGDAPLWTEPYTDITTSGSKPQTKASVLIDSLIIPDLQKAYTLIQKQQTPVVWSINEGAICAILADVYMWRAGVAGLGTPADYTNAITWYNKLFTAKTPTTAAYGTATGPTAANLETATNWKNAFLAPANSPEGIFSIYWDYTVNGCACIPIHVGLSNNPVQLDPNFQAKWKLNKAVDNRILKSIDTNTTFNHINLFYKYVNLTPTSAGLTPNNANALVYNEYLPMYRLSDVVLSYAEALTLQLAPDLTNALKFLNLIHTRAGYTAYTAASFTTPTAMEDGILQERQFELVGEGKRWFDLVRTGRVHQVMDPVLNLRNATTTTVGSTTVITPDTKGFVDAPNRYYWPVSQSALNANKLLKQNPGY